MDYRTVTIVLDGLLIDKRKMLHGTELVFSVLEPVLSSSRSLQPSARPREASFAELHGGSCRLPNRDSRRSWEPVSRPKIAQTHVLARSGLHRSALSLPSSFGDRPSRSSSFPN
jgi:hypothetical protein